MSNQKDPDLPPFIKNWPQMHLVVAGALVAFMLFSYWFMTYFS